MHSEGVEWESGKSGVYSMECTVQSVECKVGSVKCEV